MDYKETYKKAAEKEAKGDLLKAAKLYEASGYHFKAIRLYEILGDIQNAYRIAKRNSLNHEVDRLAFEYGLKGHEYQDFPKTGYGIQEDKRIALQSRLGTEAMAGKLGFKGFRGKVVADIGGAMAH